MKFFSELFTFLFPPTPPTIEELRMRLTPEEREAVDELTMDVWTRYPIHRLPIEEKRKWYTKEFAQQTIELRKLRNCWRICDQESTPHSHSRSHVE